MKTQPIVSVVMCTYNGELFIDEQINTILNQDFKDWELIILDDCSSDGTWQKLLDWQAVNPLIKVYKNEINLGYNKNFEKGIKMATAEFIAISDQDDIWLPQKLSKLLAAFTSNEIVLTHSRSVRWENGKLQYHLARLHRHFGGGDTRRLFFSNHIMGHDMMFRKSLVTHALPIPDGMFYDWWIAVMATCLGKIGAVDEYLVHQGIHANNNFFNNNVAIKKKEIGLEETLQMFTTINVLKPDNKIYLQKLLQTIIDKRKYKKDNFYLPLFLFLHKNRRLIFGHKIRFIPAFSYLKNTIKYARKNMG